jgi:cAMP phosphodiesterase
MKIYGLYFTIFFVILNLQASILVSNEARFVIIPLGVSGGLDESNLSSYLVKVENESQFISLDAGTIYSGIKKAMEKGTFTPFTDPQEVQKKYINSYFISHGHLDHTAGLILNSPTDNFNKKIYAIPSVIEIIKTHYFNSKSWPNFGNEGNQPVIGKYHYTYLVPEEEVSVEGTSLFITPFLLSHDNPYESTAFLVRNYCQYILYLGDTGADKIEKSNRIANLWNHIAPLIKNGQLKSIMIEVSFTNDMPNSSLYGHLNTKWLMEEMDNLYNIAGDNLKDVVILITHIKPCIDCKTTIIDEINKANHRGLKFYFPKQGELITLP